MNYIPAIPKSGFNGMTAAKEHLFIIEADRGYSKLRRRGREKRFDVDKWEELVGLADGFNKETVDVVLYEEIMRNPLYHKDATTLTDADKIEKKAIERQVRDEGDVMVKWGNRMRDGEVGYAVSALKQEIWVKEEKREWFRVIRRRRSMMDVDVSG